MDYLVLFYPPLEHVFVNEEFKQNYTLIQHPLNILL